jgi:hypothetical protein
MTNNKTNKSQPLYSSISSSCYSDSEPSSPNNLFNNLNSCSNKNLKIIKSFEDQLENLNNHFTNESAIKISINNLDHLINQIFESQDEKFFHLIM